MRPCIHLANRSDPSRDLVLRVVSQMLADLPRLAGFQSSDVSFCETRLYRLCRVIRLVCICHSLYCTIVGVDEMAISVGGG
jgi:hypothetical protein